MANLMGFKKVDKIPTRVGRKGTSIYDPLLSEAMRTGGNYMLDTKDQKRAYSLSATLRKLIQKRGYKELVVGVRYTIVYVTKEES